MRMTRAAARPTCRPTSAITNVQTPKTTGANHGEYPEQAQARAGEDVVQAQRHEQAEYRPRSVEVVRRWGQARANDEVQAVRAERDGSDDLAGLADRVAPVMPDEDAHQWRNAIPETEHRGDSQRAAPVGAKPPEGNRRPEVVQA